MELWRDLAIHDTILEKLYMICNPHEIEIGIISEDTKDTMIQYLDSLLNDQTIDMNQYIHLKNAISKL